MVSSARVAGSSPASAAASAPAPTACRGPVATRRGGLGILLYREHPGGEAEQRKTRVAQEAAAAEPDLRELFVVDLRLEFGYSGFVQRHARLPPVGRFLFRDLNKASILRQGASRFYEFDQGGGAPVQMNLSGYSPSMYFQRERRAFEIQGLG
jgi:hypothetical protein